MVAWLQVSVSEQGQNVLSTLSFLGPGREGSNKLVPLDRGHYSCQFENQVTRAGGPAWNMQPQLYSYL